MPLLVRALGFPTHLATATSHFVLAIMAGTGTVTHVALAASAMGTASAAPWRSRSVSSPGHNSVHTSRSGVAAPIQWLLAGALLALAARLLYSA